MASLHKIRSLGLELADECARLEYLIDDLNALPKPKRTKSSPRGLRPGSMAYRAYHTIADMCGEFPIDEVMERMGEEPTAKAKRDLTKTIRGYIKKGRYFDEGSVGFMVYASPDDP